MAPPRWAAPCRWEACFERDASAHRREIWKTDGTTAGTVMIADMFGPSSVGPVELCACGDRLFFRHVQDPDDRLPV